MTHPPRHRLKIWQFSSLLAAGAGAGISAALCWDNVDRLWPAYLYAFFACWLVCMGGMGLLALGNLTGGRWAAVARPFYLAAAQTTPLVAILFIPIGVFAQHIYPWVNLTPGELPAPKEVYLEIVFFCQRGVAYFVIWLLLAWLLSSVSRLHLPPASTPGMRRVGAASLVLLVPSATFAAFDWGMSLEPEWYSSIYGALASAGGVLAAHALAICGLVAIGEPAAAAILRRAGIEVESITYGEHPGTELHVPGATGPKPIQEHVAALFNDLGSLLLAFLMVWAYFSVSQFLIIWSANLPSEITWYLARLERGWEWLAVAIVVLHFVVPFMLLLSRPLKRRPRHLARVAMLILAMYFLHVYWMIAPPFEYYVASWHALNAAALAALFGVWLGLFSWLACRSTKRDVGREPAQTTAPQ